MACTEGGRLHSPLLCGEAGEIVEKGALHAAWFRHEQAQAAAQWRPLKHVQWATSEAAIGRDLGREPCTRTQQLAGLLRVTSKDEGCGGRRQR